MSKKPIQLIKISRKVDNQYVQSCNQEEATAYMKRVKDAMAHDFATKALDSVKYKHTQPVLTESPVFEVVHLYMYAYVMSPDFGDSVRNFIRNSIEALPKEDPFRNHGEDLLRRFDEANPSMS
jgi:hypothetical protein